MVGYVAGGEDAGDAALGGHAFEAGADVFIQSGQRDEVGNEDVCDRCRGEKEEAMFDDSLGDFCSADRSGGQFFPRRSIAIDQSFNPPENVVKKHGVGASPATPDPA